MSTDPKTTDADPADGGDLVADALGTDHPSVEPLGKKSFAPWHKTRKHFIRITQWCHHTRRLLRHLALNDRPLRYLGLPGDEMLDLRVLAGVCANQSVRMSVVGFNLLGQDRRMESDLSEAEVKKLGGIDAAAFRIINDPFERIAAVDSVARKVVEDRGPFDVINIDLCDSAFDEGPLTRGSTLDALRELIEIQTAQSGTPFLMFVSSRIGDGAAVDASTQELLFKLVDENLAAPAFEAEFKTRFGIRAWTGPAAGAVPPEALPKFYGLAVGKWLLNLVHQRQWRVQLVAFMAYHVHSSDEVDMLSFGFRFERDLPPILDGSGLTEDRARAQPRPTQISESESARGLVAQSLAMVDVDAYLATNQDIFEKFDAKNRDFLAQARFDRDEYDRWSAETREGDGSLAAFMKKFRGRADALVAAAPGAAAAATSLVGAIVTEALEEVGAVPNGTADVPTTDVDQVEVEKVTT